MIYWQRGIAVIVKAEALPAEDREAVVFLTKSYTLNFVIRSRLA